MDNKEKKNGQKGWNVSSREEERACREGIIILWYLESGQAHLPIRKTLIKESHVVIVFPEGVWLLHIHLGHFCSVGQ